MIRMIRSFLGFIWNALTLGGEAFVDWCEDQVVGIRDMLYILAFAPAAIMVMGIGIGWIGYFFTFIPMVMVGKFFIALAALLLALGMGFVWLRFGVLTEAIVVLSAAVKKIPIVTPNAPDLAASRSPAGTSVGFNMTNLVDVWSLNTGIDQAMAKDILHKVMGVMAWLAIFGVYASFFPVYTNPIAFVVVLTVGVFVAFAIVGWQRKSKLGEHVAFYFALAVIVLATLNFGQTIMRYRVNVVKMRQQALDAKEYERWAEKTRKLYGEFGSRVKDAASPNKKVSLDTVCDQCLWKENCDCKVVVSPTCVKPQCKDQRYNVKLNNARTKYHDAIAQMEGLKAEMTPGTPGEIWAYAKEKTSETAEKVSVPLTAEMGSFDKEGDRKKASFWIYGTLLILSLFILIVSLCFLMNERRWLKTVAAIVGLAAFVGLSASGYGILMCDTHCALKMPPVAKSQAIKPVPSPAEPEVLLEPEAPVEPKVQPGLMVKAPTAVIQEIEEPEHDKPVAKKIGGLTKDELWAIDDKLAALQQDLEAMDL